MLTLYRRHLKRCSKADDRYWKRCSCPMWVEGTANGTYIRRSLQTASWERAQGLALEIESADDPKAVPAKKEDPVTIQKAVDEYLADAKARDLAESTLDKLETIFRKQFLGWAKAEGYKLLRELDLRAIQSLRTTWKDEGPLGPVQGIDKKTHSGFSATTTISRTAFGIAPKFPTAVVGDEVRLMIDLDVVKQ